MSRGNHDVPIPSELDCCLGVRTGEPSRPEKGPEVHWDSDASSRAVVDTFTNLDTCLKANTPTRLSCEFRVRYDLAAMQALPAT